MKSPLVLSFALLGAISVDAAAQQGPLGGHAGGAGAGAGVSHNGNLELGVGVTLPPARGGVPVPFGITYGGGTSAGELGVGWSLAANQVRRTVDLTYTRPKFFVGEQPPEPIDRVYVTLMGATVLMVPEFPGVYRPMVGNPGMTLIDDGYHGWLLHDGSGNTYEFREDPRLGDAGVWLLTWVNDTTGRNPVRYLYDVVDIPVGGGDLGKEVDLVAIEYNTHPSGACAKHRIELTYEQPNLAFDQPPATSVAHLDIIGADEPAPHLAHIDGALVPFAIGAGAGGMNARARVLTAIDVLAHGNSCGEDSARERISGYRFGYARDRDTGRPRLASSDRVGRADSDARLPIGRYEYGSVLDRGLAMTATQIEPWPSALAGVAERALGITEASSWLEMDTPQMIADLTGDGRADVIVDGASGLEILGAGNASAGARSEPRVSLQAQPLPLGLDAPLANVNTEIHSPNAGGGLFFQDIFSELVDFNGDGRLDLLHADSETSWSLYLNMPAAELGGSPGGIVWDRRVFDVTSFRAELIDRKLLPAGFDDIVPVSRRATGNRRRVSREYTWNGTSWFPSGSYDIPLGGQTTHTLWKLTDVNGDGYPDLVASELAATMFEHESGVCDLSNLQGAFPGETVRCNTTYELALTANPHHQTAPQTPERNRLLARYNRAGNRLPNGPWPFAAPVVLEGTEHCGVETWDARGGSWELSEMRCGLVELNGDGIPDFIEPDREPVDHAPALVRARLGTGAGFAGELRLPGAPTLYNGATACHPTAEGVEPATEYSSGTSAAYVDLTGDGLPDFLAAGHLHVGTGTGWMAPRPMHAGGFAVTVYESTTHCTTRRSTVTAGLYDFDGDGRLDFARASDQGIEIYRLHNSSGVGAYDAARITAVDNGYGARMTVRYVSAKNDIVARHDTPFAEIVVSETQLSTADQVLEPTRMAYGGSRSWFDAASDRWVPTGFGRRITLTGMTLDDSTEMPLADASGWSDRPGGLVGRATILDLDLATNSSASYEAYATHGRERATYQLDGHLPLDPWLLLDFDESGAYSDRLHAKSNTEWRALARSSAAAGSCVATQGYKVLAGQPSIALNGRWDSDCGHTGLAYVKQSTGWEGDHTGGIRTGSLVREVDSWGRPLLIEQQRDLKDDYAGALDAASAMDARTDVDNTCIHVSYASARPYVLNTASEYVVRSCGSHQPSTTLTRVVFSYDDLANVIGTTSYRFETSAGIAQDSVRERIIYDPFGNAFVHSATAAGVTRTAASADYDAFALAPSRSQSYTSDSSTPSIESTVVRDPVTLAVLSATDTHGTTSTFEYDGFGRPRSAGVIPAGASAEYLLEEKEYLGLAAGEPGPPHVIERSYPDVATQPIERRTVLDGLGRVKYVEQALGDSYDETLIVGETTYDRLGRKLFVADAYPAGNRGSNPYGTTLHYRPDGSLSCQIRAPGVVGLEQRTDEGRGVYPSCFVRSYRDQNLVMRAYGPEDLMNGLGEHGPYWEEVLSATGRVLERSRVDESGTRRELSRFGYDRLGAVVAVKRYADPVAASNPVLWAFVRDSDGRALAVSEPSAATVHSEFDAFGNLLETSWDNDAGSHRVLYAYDGLGRLTREEEKLNDISIPGSVVTYAYDEASTEARWSHRRGRLSSVTKGQTSVQYGYDALGRLSSVARLVEGQAYDESYAYRLDGQLAAITYALPDGGHQPETASYEYDSAGRMRAARWSDATTSEEIFRAVDVDLFGRPLELRYGPADGDSDGVVETYEYRPDRRRELLNTSLRTRDGNQRGTVFSAYTPDLLVREKLEADIAPSGQLRIQSSRYSYDHLRRIESSVVSDASGSMGAASRVEVYRYDALGNLIGRDDRTGPNDLSLTMRTDDPDRICDEGVAAVDQPGAALPDSAFALPSDSADFGDFASSATTVVVEAEDGILAAPFAVKQDPTVSGGAYLTVPEQQVDNPFATGGAVVLYAVDVPEDGYYRLYGRVRADSGTRDSFFVHIDGNEALTWNIGHTPEWEVRRMTHSDGASEVPIGATLTAGTHVLALRNREAGTSIDQIYLTTDAVNPPTDAIEPPVDSCGYRYDSLGNVVTVPALHARPSRHFSYDVRGRIKGMTSGGTSATYAYGPEGDVVALDVMSDDPAQVRTERHVGPHVSRATFNVVDPLTGGTWSEARIERRIPGVPVVRRGYGAGAEVVYSHGDAAGVRRVTNRAGAITQELSYRPFGGIVEDTGIEHGLTSSADGFNGGNHLRPFGVVHIGARIYDPHTSRFMQRDPLLATSSATMMNPYAFAWNDPINYTDVTGLYPGPKDCLSFNCGPPIDWGDVLTGMAAQDEKFSSAEWVRSIQQDPYLLRYLQRYHIDDLRRLAALGRADREHHATVQFSLAAGHLAESMNRGSFGEQFAGGLIVGVVEDTYNDATDATGYGWKHHSIERSARGAGWTILAVTPAKLIRAPKIVKRGYGLARAGAQGTRAYKVGLKAVEASGAALIAAGTAARGASARVLSVVQRGGRSAERGVGGSGVPVKTAINPLGGATNCVNCSVALDATLAGHWAQALLGKPVSQLSQIPKMFGKTSFDGSFSSLGEVRAAISSLGPGARGVVVGMNGRVGHAFNVVNKRGSVRFLDGQGLGIDLGSFKQFHLIITGP